MIRYAQPTTFGRHPVSKYIEENRPLLVYQQVSKVFCQNALSDARLGPWGKENVTYASVNNALDWAHHIIAEYKRDKLLYFSRQLKSPTSHAGTPR